MHCYWCKTRLNRKDRTIDHFISRPVWAEKCSIIRSRTFKCDACYECNNKRAAISSLYSELRRLRSYEPGTKRKENIIRQAKRCREGFYKQRRKLYKDIMYFKPLVDRIARFDVREVCLLELDEILAYGWKQEDIPVRAYYLWEKAGRPHGYHEHFWLLAEQEVMLGF